MNPPDREFWTQIIRPLKRFLTMGILEIPWNKTKRAQLVEPRPCPAVKMVASGKGLTIFCLSLYLTGWTWRQCGRELSWKKRDAGN